MTNYSPDNLPTVSIIIPSHNEEKFIGRCLDSIIAQDYPKEKMEVLVVDGMSGDRTREIVKRYTEQHTFIKLLDNLKKITPCALNLGIKNSKGEVIIIMGAHAEYKNDYISKCVKYLYEYNADNVGGRIITLPQRNTFIAKAIVKALTSRFGVGNSDFRIGTNQSKENLKRSQDLEFNLRLKRMGGKIILVSDIVSYYYAKSNFNDFFLHNFEDGIWSIYPFKFVKIHFKLRHYIPLFFVLTLPVSIWPYILFSLFFSFQIAIREKDFRYFFLMPISFLCRHLAYSLGSLVGLIKVLFSGNLFEKKLKR
jgi:glycosyltransferase involved in cell wall biosynthesis